jgi:hypothetical protein
MTEIPGQIYCLSSVKLASSMLFVQKLSHKIITDQWNEICIADRSVFCLRNENIFFLLLQLLFLLLLLQQLL